LADIDTANSVKNELALVDPSCSFLAVGAAGSPSGDAPLVLYTVPNEFKSFSRRALVTSMFNYKADILFNFQTFYSNQCLFKSFEI
jgi:hypothetical protein